MDRDPPTRRRSARSESDPILGTLIDGDLLVERAIGSGSHADVFVARQKSVGDRRVAVKVLCRPYLALREADFRRASMALQREAAVLGQMRSACFVAVYRTGTLPDQRPFVVMELIEGETVADLFARPGGIEPAKVFALMLQMARGLAELHALGHVHRDVTPANLMVASDPLGEPLVKLIDFGTVTRISDRADRFRVGYDLEHPLGTASYMAPEQARGDVVDGRADQFALAAVLFEALTGRRAIDVPSHSQRVVLEFLRGDAAIPTAADARASHGGLLSVALRALARDPARRLPDMRAFAFAIREAWHTGAAAPARGGTLFGRLLGERGRG